MNQLCPPAPPLHRFRHSSPLSYSLSPQPRSVPPSLLRASVLEPPLRNANPSERPPPPGTSLLPKASGKQEPNLPLQSSQEAPTPDTIPASSFKLNRRVPRRPPTPQARRPRQILNPPPNKAAPALTVSGPPIPKDGSAGHTRRLSSLIPPPASSFSLWRRLWRA